MVAATIFSALAASADDLQVTVEQEVIATGLDNPRGLSVDRHGVVLVAEAGGNDLLQVGPGRRIKVLATFPIQMVDAPARWCASPSADAAARQAARTPVPVSGKPGFSQSAWRSVGLSS